MKNTYKTLKIYFIIILALTAAGIALRTVALFTVYEPIGYFKTGALMPILFHALCVATVAAALSSLVVIRSNDNLSAESPKVGTLQRIAAILPLIATGVLAVYYMYMVAGADRSATSVPVTGSSSAVWIIAFICAIPGVIYFLSVALGKGGNSRKNENLAIPGIFVIFFSLLSLAATYFDFTTAMNSPNKLLLQISYMAVMIYMLFELRFIIGIAKPRAYAATSLSSVFLCLVSSVPAMIAYFAGVFTKLDYFFCHFFMLAFGLYIAARYLSFLAKAKK